jgi:hypothetical protein
MSQLFSIRALKAISPMLAGGGGVAVAVAVATAAGVDVALGITVGVGVATAVAVAVVVAVARTGVGVSVAATVAVAAGATFLQDGRKPTTAHSSSIQHKAVSIARFTVEGRIDIVFWIDWGRSVIAQVYPRNTRSATQGTTSLYPTPHTVSISTPLPSSLSRRWATCTSTVRVCP